MTLQREGWGRIFAVSHLAAVGVPGRPGCLCELQVKVTRRQAQMRKAGRHVRRGEASGAEFGAAMNEDYITQMAIRVWRLGFGIFSYSR